MIRAIEKAYSESARVNQNLSIEFNDRNRLPLYTFRTSSIQNWNMTEKGFWHAPRA